MKKILSNRKKALTSKGFAALLMMIFFVSASVTTLEAQDDMFHFGLRGGVGMSTLSGFPNSGLKLGFTGGVYFDYDIKKNNILTAELYYSSGGQQSETLYESNNEKIKIYNRYSLHYINLPIIYQYYFTDILVIEVGPNFRYCMNGGLKTKIGNGSWQKEEFSTDDYNTFDFGMILGIYTDNLIPHDNFFVSLRAYFGFLDVIKNVGANKNISVYVGIGYMLF